MLGHAGIFTALFIGEHIQPHGLQIFGKRIDLAHNTVFSQFYGLDLVIFIVRHQVAAELYKIFFSNAAVFTHDLLHQIRAHQILRQL